MTLLCLKVNFEPMFSNHSVNDYLMLSKNLEFVVWSVAERILLNTSKNKNKNSTYTLAFLRCNHFSFTGFIKKLFTINNLFLTLAKGNMGNGKLSLTTTTLPGNLCNKRLTLN